MVATKVQRTGPENRDLSEERHCSSQAPTGLHTPTANPKLSIPSVAASTQAGPESEVCPSCWLSYDLRVFGIHYPVSSSCRMGGNGVGVAGPQGSFQILSPGCDDRVSTFCRPTRKRNFRDVTTTFLLRCSPPLPPLFSTEQDVCSRFLSKTTLRE